MKNPTDNFIKLPIGLSKRWVHLLTNNRRSKCDITFESLNALFGLERSSL
ncbi:hypothetical protein [Pedobacter changchengzhani]|nr:hypothetical protein [Pedobacter changchengzhani]